MSRVIYPPDVEVGDTVRVVIVFALVMLILAVIL